MTRTWLASATSLALMSGVAVAQTTTSTTTYQTNVPVVVPVPAPVTMVPVPAPVTETTTQRTIDDNGVVTDHSRTITDSTAVSPYGDTTRTRRTTETTTVR